MEVQSIKSFQIAFAALCLIAILLAVVALFTPGWRHVAAEAGQIQMEKQLTLRYHFDVNLGIFGFACTQRHSQIEIGIDGQQSDGEAINVCKQWADTKQPFETVVASLFIVGILFTLAAFVFALLLLFGKFREWERARWALPPLSSITTVLLIIGFIVFLAKGCAEDGDGLMPGWKDPNCSFGYSIFLAAAAALASLLASIVGGIVVLLNHRLVRGSNWS